MHLEQIGDILRAGLVALFFRDFVVQVKGVLGGAELGGQQYQGIAMPGSPLHRLNANG